MGVRLHNCKGITKGVGAPPHNSVECEKAMSLDPTSRPPVPPFTCATATQKVRLAEDAWNTRDPARVALASTLDSTWRNRSEFPVGREAIVQFLQRKWAKELDYRLIKELWAFHDARIAVRFAY